MNASNPPIVAGPAKCREGFAFPVPLAVPLFEFAFPPGPLALPPNLKICTVSVSLETHNNELTRLKEIEWMRAG
jgi:hypothetical protein